MSNEAADRTQDYEGIIGRVKDVLSARVVVDNSGNPCEIHVLARLRRSAKQIVRDIESVMMTTFGQSVDANKISIAQIKDNSEATFSPVRLMLEGVKVTARGNEIDVNVALIAGQRRLKGEASGLRVASNRLRCVAAATANAISEYLGKNIGVSVTDFLLTDLGGQRVAIVSVTVVNAHTRSEERLIGSSFVRADDRESIARATLDALNRRLDALKRGEN